MLRRTNSLFFFSSRRRHTRYIGDWSSDVCSSDLLLLSSLAACHNLDSNSASRGVFVWTHETRYVPVASFRSEERRVGKECRIKRRPGRKNEKKNRCMVAPTEPRRLTSDEWGIESA